jgi:hypothetical protein
MAPDVAVLSLAEEVLEAGPEDESKGDDGDGVTRSLLLLGKGVELREETDELAGGRRVGPRRGRYYRTCIDKFAYTPGNSVTRWLPRVGGRSRRAIRPFNGESSRPGFGGRMTGSQLIEVDGRIWCDFGTGVLKTAVFGTVLIGRDSW